jgi:predicted DNA-binding transcriptional regulator AlpA
MDKQFYRLREVAEMTGLSYDTIYGLRHKIAQRFEGSRIYLVHRSHVDTLTNNPVKSALLSLRAVEEKTCLSSNVPTAVSGGWISPAQTARELKELLARPTAKKRKNFTTA